MSATDTRELEKELLAGLEGATPGPWKAVCQPNFENGYTYTSVQPVQPDPEKMRHLAMASGEYHVCRMTHTPLERKFRLYRHDAEHIARCSPDNIRALLATIADLRATVAEAGWRPIETAPMDGSWVWLYVPGHGEVRARWGGAGWSSHGGRMVIRATHWMPLPQPPATAKHGGSNAAE